MKKVNKSVARRAYNTGKKVAICPCYVSPFSSWFSGIYTKDGADSSIDFDKLCDMIAYYTCNAELGRTLVYYIEEE